MSGARADARSKGRTKIRSAPHEPARSRGKCPCLCDAPRPSIPHQPHAADTPMKARRSSYWARGRRSAGRLDLGALTFPNRARRRRRTLPPTRRASLWNRPRQASLQNRFGIPRPPLARGVPHASQVPIEKACTAPCFGSRAITGILAARSGTDGPLVHSGSRTEQPLAGRGRVFQGASIPLRQNLIGREAAGPRKVQEEIPNPGP